MSSCTLDSARGPSTVAGWAFDGSPIVVERDPGGSLPADAGLDSCHGRTSPILLGGMVVTTYHRDATIEYPCTLGCLHGEKTTAGAPNKLSSRVRPGLAPV